VSRVPIDKEGNIQWDKRVIYIDGKWEGVKWEIQ
jgi:hypothetical protein